VAIGGNAKIGFERGETGWGGVMAAIRVGEGSQRWGLGEFRKGRAGRVRKVAGGVEKRDR
jgi:hypothetical protein